jgi:hypothetical protein
MKLRENHHQHKKQILIKHFDGTVGRGLLFRPIDITFPAMIIFITG